MKYFSNTLILIIALLAAAFILPVDPVIKFNVTGSKENSSGKNDIHFLPGWSNKSLDIVAPNVPVDPLPVNGSTTVTLSPDVCARVTDNSGGILRTRFYGRKKPQSGSGKFTVIMLPDTQYYTEEPQGNHDGGSIAMFNAQTTWIAANRASKNIVYVGQLGDCVENGDNPPGANNDIEWLRAVAAMEPIERAAQTGLPQGIPFGICVGNHDQTPIGTATGTTDKYNLYFGINHFMSRGYYGGHYGSNNDNHYQLFSASGIDFLVISFEYDQSATFSTAGGALDWAENLVQIYADRKVIVMTHYGINETPAFGTQGLAIYNRLKPYSNFILFTCGHMHTSDGEARRADVYNGNTVHTLLSDYQQRPGGGSGLLRIYEFDPQLNTIAAKTYSPHTNTFETDADSEFTLDVNLGAYTMIGEVNTASGTVACVNWPGLLELTEYEWYAESFDGLTTTIGPLWTFTTPPNPPLPVTYLSFTGIAEKNRVKLFWKTASEINNREFIVERSADGIIYKTIGEVAGNGNSVSGHNYSFYDMQPLNGKALYRLRQVDRDNHVHYSSTVVVNYFNRIKLDILPNPAGVGEAIKLFFNVAVKGEVQVAIHDISGRMVYNFVLQNPVGNYRLDTRLPAGTYTLITQGKDSRESLKFVVKPR